MQSFKYLSTALLLASAALTTNAHAAPQKSHTVQYSCDAAHSVQIDYQFDKKRAPTTANFTLNNQTYSLPLNKQHSDDTSLMFGDETGVKLFVNLPLDDAKANAQQADAAKKTDGKGKKRGKDKKRGKLHQASISIHSATDQILYKNCPAAPQPLNKSDQAKQADKSAKSDKSEKTGKKPHRHENHKHEKRGDRKPQTDNP